MAKTVQEVRAELHRMGMSIADYAAAKNADLQSTYNLLCSHGRYKGCRGKSHDTAVKLGLKDGPIIGNKAWPGDANSGTGLAA